MTTQQQSLETPGAPTPPRRVNFHWPVIAALAIALVLLWHFGIFRSKPRIAIVTSGDTPYWDEVVKGAEKAATDYDVKLKVVRSKTNFEAQAEAIRNLLSEKYDGIAVSPIDPVAQAGVLAEVAANAPLVTFDSDSPVANRLCFVGTDNYAAGRRCGEIVRRAIPDGGEVILFVGNLNKENTQRRRQGVIDELLDRPFEQEHPMDPAEGVLKGEKYTVVATMVDGSEPNVATDMALKAVKEHPNVKCLVGLLGYTTPAILEGLKQTDKLGKVMVVGFDNDSRTLAGISAGSVYATVLQDQFGCGFHTVRILAETARGDRSGLPVFQRRTLPVEVVTKDNVSAVASQFGQPAAPTTSPAN